MVTPKARINGKKSIKDAAMPLMVIMAKAQAVIVTVDPDRWVVTHKGMTNAARNPRAPIFFVSSSVTGIVAADDCDPSAVKEAVTIILINAKGLFLLSPPAIKY